MKKILVNNQISYFQYKLQLGDTISIIPVPEKDKSISKVPKTKLKCSISISDQIVFENSEMVIINKRAGQIVQPSYKLNCYSLEELLQQYLKSNSKLDVQIEYQAKFIHRIDHPVSGLLIGAKTANSHQLLSNSLKNREIKKIYRAIVFGFFAHESLRIRNWIVDKHSKVKVLKDPNNESKLAVSEIKRLKGNSKYSYLEINLITGRKNQIRAQLAELGHPILGDRKYYSEKFKSNIHKEGVKGLPFNSKQIALCSYQLVFPENLKKPLNLSRQNFSLPPENNVLLSFAKKI